MPVHENDRVDGPPVKIEYEISRRALGIYDSRKEAYAKGDFQGAIRELASHFEGIVPCASGENAARIEITGENGTGEGIFPEVRKFLFDRGYEITEIIKLPGLTFDTFSALESEANDNGKTIALAMGIDPIDGYVEIRRWPLPQQA
jgi:hypothetical protein